ncbi:MAG: YncE family protein, partial [Thaumarchaeota archaeon]|nr:YncE family protein [Nitrososphaerota archaeon]
MVATIQVGDGPSSIAINTHTNMIYVANMESNTVSVINGTTNSVVSTLHLCNLYGTNFAVDESTNTIYLTCTGPQGEIAVISGAENKVINTIDIGRDPNRLAFNPRTDMLYTANNGDGTVSVVSAQDNKLKDTIHVEPFPNFVAVNPVTNTVYVTADSYKNHTLSVISGVTDKILATIDVDIGA